MSFYRFIIAVLVSALLLSGCSFIDRWVYRPDINQGNYVTQEAAEKLAVGQTKEQVSYIMGSPMLKSVFGDDIWYFVFREKPQHGYVTQKTYTVVFDSNGLVSNIKVDSYDDVEKKESSE